MHLTAYVRQQKLAKLLAAAGCDSPEELEAVYSDRAPPAICIQCDAITEAEDRDQSAGFCTKCRKKTVVSALVLAAEGPVFAATINKVSSLLTQPAIQALNAAVDLSHQDPALVAKEFLVAHGLVPATQP